MKKLSTTQLAMSYTGIFLGAGFVSGQELWQFFACFGPVGLIGFIGTAALFFYVNYANLRLIQLTGQEDMGRLMTCGNHPKLRAAVSAMQNLLLEKALQIVSDCPCPQGCPSCAGPVGEIGTDGKATAKVLLKELIACP